MGLSPQTIDICKATAPVLAEHGYAITTAMYNHMLPNNPKVSELFNPTHQIVLPGEKHARQPLSLAQAVLAYASNIDNLGALGCAVERIAQKHVSVHILPEHYPIVGENLLWAIKHILRDAATDDIMKAWEEAYFFLADIFIGREKEIRDTLEASKGGWEGWRDFIIKQKVVESNEITSFYLQPKDGAPILTYQPGQYIGVRIETAEFTTQRNYSLSQDPTTAVNTNEYRVSIKKEGPMASGCPMGRVSSHFHDQLQVGDTVKLSVPCGDFVLDVKHDKPLVFISAGVGVTPIASMVENVVSNECPNKVTVINAARNQKTQAMFDAFNKLAQGHDNVKVHNVYSEEVEGFPHGRLNASLLDSLLNDHDNHYYFCGPPCFMESINKILLDWEVPPSQIHFEFFGPHDA